MNPQTAQHKNRVFILKAASSLFSYKLDSGFFVRRFFTAERFAALLQRDAGAPATDVLNLFLEVTYHIKHRKFKSEGFLWL